MCRYKYVWAMYICTSCLFQTSVRTPAPVWSTGHAAHRALQTGPRLGVQQELTQQLSCLWFQKCVHLWPKLKDLSSFISKNKIHLPKWSFPVFRYQFKTPRPQAVWMALCLLDPVRDSQLFFWRKHQARSGSSGAPKPVYCNPPYNHTYTWQTRFGGTGGTM